MSQDIIEQPKEMRSKKYSDFLKRVKEKILSSQVKAAVSVNQELISLYWEIGSALVQKQKEEGWGAKAIEKLAKDLRFSFSNMKGFSLTNIKYMAQFSKIYPDFLNSQQIVGQIPWGHNILIIQRIRTLEERLWYVKKTNK